MTTVEILGRDIEEGDSFSEGAMDKGRVRGCAFMGKMVSYPGGRYEEIGNLYIDISGPHCILVLGKRGTGKSYTLGVIAEEFASLDPDLRENVAIVIVDTMSVFHSLKRENTNASELERMRAFKALKPSAIDNVRILIPEIVAERFRAQGVDIDYDGMLSIGLNELEASDWLTLFGLKPYERVGAAIISVLSELRKRGERFGFDDIYRAIDEMYGNDPGLRDGMMALFQTAEDLRVFHKGGLGLSDIAMPGWVTVLDISYLGRMGGYDVRSLIVGIIARRMLQERTLYTTMEMQVQAGMIRDGSSVARASRHYPLVYMLIDEAHLFLPNMGEVPSSRPLIDWIKLGRHPGLSLVLATQEPSALHETAIRQSDIIIAHNLTAESDLEALKRARQSFMKAKSLDEMVATMESRRGLAIIFDDKTKKMLYCRIRPRKTLHTGIDANLFTYARLKKGTDSSHGDGSKDGKGGIRILAGGG